MVAIPAEVRVFLRNVGKKFAPQKIYLFGSRARGNAAEESDWDFIIVSKKFEGMDGYHRAVEVHQLSQGTFAFDVLCLTPSEFKTKKSEPSLIRQILNDGSVRELPM